MESMRIGVIGCGAIGRDHIRRINRVVKGATVTAVADIAADSGRQVAREWGAEFFADGRDLVSSPNVDAVLVASLDPTHETYVLAAIAAGKHVLCEKPLAPDADGCRRIVEAEIAGGRHLVQVGFMRRYDAGYRALRDMIRSDRYGSPLMVHCAHRNAILVDGYTTPMLITNCAVHEIDVLRWLLGEEYTGCRVALPRKTRHTPSSLHDPQIIFLYTDSGIHSDIEVFINCRYGYDIRCEVVCEEASLSLPTPTAVSLLHDGTRSLAVSDDWKERFIHAYDTEIGEWLDAVRRDVVEGPTSWDGYQTALTAAACTKARESGEWVAIPREARPEFYTTA
ncbi:MAG: Gfo/Idh/MocA family oxidoreductase [Planctomycetes bacterium]|nr:Gfo/Idh/MocA family oxidoreductase [Planctomycetota bacterium]